MERGLQSIINEVGQIEIENAEYPYKIQLGKVKLQQPRMMELDGSITHITPAEARLTKCFILCTSDDGGKCNRRWKNLRI